VKVVLFCGGFGMRLRDYSETIPKPLAEIGSRPIIWHLMKYYSHYGFRDFVLCLGHGGAAIKRYFANYEEYLSNDFILSDGGKRLQLLKSDIEDWRITFVDTGLKSNIGMRLSAVREHLAGEEYFLANYADGVSDLDCRRHVDQFVASKKIACFLSVRVPQTFHVVHADEAGYATAMQNVADTSIRINGGFFVFNKKIFEYMHPGEELVVEPFQRLMQERQLLAVQHDGFWHSMDTFKDKIQLEEMVREGRAPWQVWL